MVMNTQIPMGAYRYWNPKVSELGVYRVKVVGIATTGAPVIGRSYIVELPEGLKLPSYPYSHVVAFECHLSESVAEPLWEPNPFDHYMVCPWCNKRRFKAGLDHSFNVQLVCSNNKCGKIGTITKQTWDKISPEARF